MAVDTQRIKHVRPRLTLEAMQIDGTKEGAQAVVDWAKDARAYVEREGDHYVVWFEGPQMVGIKCGPGDWIMKAITGKFFAMPDEQFREIYQEVGERVEFPPSSMVPKQRL